MNYETLKVELIACANQSKRDPESAHLNADLALLSYINQKEITRLYHNIDKDYA